MKYRTKLYLALVLVALACVLIGFIVLFFSYKKHQFVDEQNKAMTVAATMASTIDPSLVKQVISDLDEHSDAYHKLKEELIRVRDVNRREHIYIKFIYVITRSPFKKNELIFLADGEEDPKKSVHLGEVDTQAMITKLGSHLTETYASPQLLHDAAETWVSGFAPVYDEEGRYLATIRADIAQREFVKDLERIIPYYTAAFIASILLSVICAGILSHQFTRSLNSLVDCVKEIGHGNLEFKANLTTHDEFEVLADEIHEMAHGLREREKLKLNFARYVSHHVLEKILSSEAMTKLEGERRIITVLFSDIRQFTYLAEHLPPEQVVSLLNEYFEAMLDVIFTHHGTLDKFIGDGIMVEFGAPLDDPHQERHAVLTAIDMHKALSRLLDKWRKEGKPPIQMGIGIHTGFAIVGNIGSMRRMEYTAIGDTVNVASRLEQATKTMKKQILVSQTTYDAIKHEFKATSLGSIVLPGRVEPIAVYAIET